MSGTLTSETLAREGVPPRTLATLHLSARNEGVKGKDGGLPRKAMELLAYYDWQKVKRFLAGEWPRPMPSSHVFTTDAERLNAWFEAASKAPYVVIDTEYTRDTRRLALIGLGHPRMVEALQVDWFSLWSGRREEVTRRLCDLVQCVPVVFQNAMADIPVIEQATGIVYEDYVQVGDTMLAHAVLWSELPHTLEFLASIHGEHEKMKHLAGTDPLLYNLGDVVDTIAVWEALRRELQEDPDSERVYREQSLPLVPVLLRRARLGIRVSRARVAPAGERYLRDLEGATRLARAWAGWPINVGSSDHLRLWLYGVEGLPVQKDKQSKRPTVDEEAIITLRSKVGEGEHPLIEARLAYMAAQQTLSHFITPLDGVERIYPQMKIHAQASGRWSITDPPLQTLPKDLEDLIIPDEGEVWIEWDWRQAEPRFLAYLSGDEPMIAALERGEDPYTQDARDIFDVYGLASPTAEQRTAAKVLRLKMSYGARPGSPEEARYRARLFAGRPALSRWFDRIEAEAHKPGPTSRSWLGRRRCHFTTGPKLFREMLNHPNQGSVSDLLNTTVIAIARACPEATIVKTKHDSGTFAVPANRLSECLPLVKSIVEREVEVRGRRVRFPADFLVIEADGTRRAA